MPIKVRVLSAEEARSLQRIAVLTYLDGECYAFAAGLHQGLGWPLVGLVDQDIVQHAAVRSPDGKLMDVRGFVSQDEFTLPFDHLSPQHAISKVTIDDIVPDHQVNPERIKMIRTARMIAEAIWPELPWLDPLSDRLTVFCQELAVLCQRHAMWMRLPVFISTLPFASDGNDGQIEIKSTPEGTAFSLSHGTDDEEQ